MSTWTPDRIEAALQRERPQVRGTGWPRHRHKARNRRRNRARRRAGGAR